MKFAHKVFHIESDSDREWLVESINIYLEKYSTPLDTPTIQIRSHEDLLNYYNNNKDFYIDPNGYSLDGKQGWKYGELGIWASNYTAWKNFLKTDFDSLILMEDDITFNDNFFPILEKYIAELPEDWDIFSFFVPFDQYHKYALHKSYGENTSLIYQDWSCLCYVLSRKGAQKSLDIMRQGVSLPLDWFYYRQTDKFNGFTIKPDVEQGCTLARLESTFQNKHERKIIDGVF
jgi:GR25 family glycosyltransferase involved in LPS biosynthesis